MNIQGICMYVHVHVPVPVEMLWVWKVTKSFMMFGGENDI